jgi:PTS system mannose-specific IIA component
MVGIVVISHGRIGIEMVKASQSIVKDANLMVGVALEHDEDLTLIRQKIAAAITEVDRGSGVLLLTDMFGGTPSNLALSFLKEGSVEVVTGVNLPMLIKIASFKEELPINEVASFIRHYGQKNIAHAGEVLQDKK